MQGWPTKAGWWYGMQYYIMLSYTVSNCTTLHHTVEATSHSITLHHTVANYIKLSHNAPHCTWTMVHKVQWLTHPGVTQHLSP